MVQDPQRGRICRVPTFLKLITDDGPLFTEKCCTHQWAAVIVQTDSAGVRIILFGISDPDPVYI
jgi:hypothetical protein